MELKLSSTLLDASVFVSPGNSARTVKRKHLLCLCLLLRNQTKRGKICKRYHAQLRIFASSSDWSIVLFVSVVIGQRDFFGLRFTTLN